jgi:hypothetical protein
MKFNHLQLRTLLLFSALFALNGLVARAQLPTTNLFVNLNTNSVDNFVTDGTLIQVWKDLAEDGSDAKRQDFGQANVNKQPTLAVNAAVPNSTHTGITYNLLDFERSATVSNANSSGPNSDFLQAKTPDTARPAIYGDPFTSGRDTAYEGGAGGNLETGLSWFVVFQNTDDSVIANNNGSQGTTSGRRWGSQAMLDSRYVDIVPADGSGRFVWGQYAIDTGDADTLGNLNNHVRGNVGDEVNLIPDPPINLGISQWYMAANTYDMVNGVFRVMVTTPDGSGGITVLLNDEFDATEKPTLVNALGIASGKELVNITLGAAGEAPTANNRDLSFDGMMAEVLIYNSALNTTDFDAAMAYLHNKYFIATGLPGDFNDDNKVDASDYVLGRKFSGNNLTVYNAWRENFGIGTGAGTGLDGSAVPEPGSVVLAACAVLATIGVSRKKRCANSDHRTELST